jgi:hypothetical protein
MMKKIEFFRNDSLFDFGVFFFFFFFWCWFWFFWFFGGLDKTNLKQNKLLMKLKFNNCKNCIYNCRMMPIIDCGIAPQKRRHRSDECRQAESDCV